MIHAENCYDSDPIDRWFDEEIEIDELLYWHLERYFDGEYIRLTDEEHWELERRFGGFDISFGNMLNQPVRAVLNAPGIWVPSLDGKIDIISMVHIAVDDVEVYRRTETDTVIAIVDQGKIWAARRLADKETLVSYILAGFNEDCDNNMVPTKPPMMDIIGPQLGMARLYTRGGVICAANTVKYTASLPIDDGPYQVGELGLYTMTRKMVAREMISPRITKDPGKKFDITWIITID